LAGRGPGCAGPTTHQCSAPPAAPGCTACRTPERLGPGEVWAALRELGADRIGHGIGAAADPALLAHLAKRSIALEVCPTSNVCTGAVPSLREHPLPALLAAGVPVALATDDPSMFHTDPNNEYVLCHNQFGLGPDELADLARVGARAAFCSEATRSAVLAEIDRLTDTG
jgi:aminodeoxyfutalosine deaminase